MAGGNGFAKVRLSSGRQPDKDPFTMLKFIGGTLGVIFIIGLLVVIGILVLIF